MMFAPVGPVVVTADTVVEIVKIRNTTETLQGGGK